MRKSEGQKIPEKEIANFQFVNPQDAISLLIWYVWQGAPPLMNGGAPCCIWNDVTSQRLAGKGRGVWSIASSARAGEHLMCSPCEQDCPSRRSNPAPLPGERSGIGGLQVRDDQFHLAFKFDLVHGARG